MDQIKASLVQLKSEGSISQNLQKTCDVIKSNASETELIILQELCLWDYFCITEDPKHFESAISLDSKECQTIQQLAKDLKKIIVFPFFEKRAKGIYHNTVAVYEKDGTLASIYRKMHIPDDPGFYEKYYFIPGDLGFQPIQTSIGKLGVLICWDQWFPEAARLMSLKGADLLIYPTAIGWDDLESKDVYPVQVDAWTTIMRSHAIANGTPTIAVNRVGREGHLKFWGNSFCSDPFGKIIERADEHFEGVKTVSIDKNMQEKARQVWPFFRDRRVDSYQSILKIWE